LIWETGSLRVGSGTEAEGCWDVAAGLTAAWDWMDLELFLVVGVAVVDLACACGGGAVERGGTEGAAEVAWLLVQPWLQLQQQLQKERSWVGKLGVQTYLELVGWK